MTLQDEKYRALRTVVGTGTVGDMERDYVASIGVSVALGQINTMWMEFWDEEIIAVGNFNDRAMEWLIGEGHTTGTLDDRWKAYWESVV